MSQRDFRMPYSEEGEQGMLGAILFGGDEAMATALDAFGDRSLYRRQNQNIWDAAKQVYDEGESVDILTIALKMRELGTLTEGEGFAYLTYLREQCPSAKNMAAYARPASDAADLRELLAGVQKVSQDIQKSDANPDEAMAQLDELVMRVTARRQGSVVHRFDDILASRMEEYAERQNGVQTGTLTGFRDVDEITGGLKVGELTVVAGRPGMGKSAYAMNIAEYVAQKMHLPVVVFSLEMSKENLVDRMVTGEARVESRDFQRGRLAAYQWAEIANAVDRLAGTQLLICDVSDMTARQMRAKMRSIQAQHGEIGLFVVDYLNIVEDDDSRLSRQQVIKSQMKAFSNISKDCRCPGIVLAQVNRGCEDTEDKRPTLKNLAEAGDIEQIAYVVKLLFRESYYPKKGGVPGSPVRHDPNDNTAEVIIAKNKNGPCGTVNLTFLPQYARFENMDHGNYQ